MTRICSKHNEGTVVNSPVAKKSPHPSQFELYMRARNGETQSGNTHSLNGRVSHQSEENSDPQWCLKCLCEYLSVRNSIR